MEYLYKPAFYAHIISSIAVITAIILLIINYKKLLRLDGIELVKVPVAYSKEFIQRFGTESIPERRDLLDWLYEKKNSK
jgi:hypothetical protein